ncbi:MAG: hypothetical protein B7Y73_03575 [Acidocella sp. 35-58-6]|nr:MAG: hypothetical protein B7Y73_03575 [Acidocella sp. 35-58-6]
MKPLLLILLLAGCAQAAPVTRLVTITPTVPGSLLQCAPAPQVPVASRQSVVARYIVALWQAGEDCRAHVAAIRQALVTP